MKQYRILCFGDSIIMGTWDPQGGWVDRLKQHFHTEYYERKRKVQVYNLGIGGELSYALAQRMESEINARLNLHWEPIIVIGIGKNDARAQGNPNAFEATPEEYEANLRKSIAIASKYSQKILLVGLGLVDESVQFKDLYYSNQRLRLFDAVNAKVAQDTGVWRVPLQEAMTQVPQFSSWFVDGIHPGEDGYSWIYDQILPNILRLID